MSSLVNGGCCKAQASRAGSRGIDLDINHRARRMWMGGTGTQEGEMNQDMKMVCTGHPNPWVDHLPVFHPAGLVYMIGATNQDIEEAHQGPQPDHQPDSPHHPAILPGVPIQYHPVALNTTRVPDLLSTKTLPTATTLPTSMQQSPQAYKTRKMKR